LSDQVWAVSLVRNEADIIAYTLAHFISQGVDGIIIQDNNSDDTTAELCLQCAKKANIPIFLRPDPPNSGFFQADKINELSKLAIKQGATHIIPFDADELWYSPLGRVADLMKGPDFGCQSVPQYFHYSTTYDNPAEDNPYKRMLYRTIDPRPWPKVCLRWFPGVSIGGGNHFLCTPSGKVTPPGPKMEIAIRHFPCRSFEQMVDKIIRHGIAMDIQYPTDPEWGMNGPHQRHLYRRYQKEGFKALFRTWLEGDGKTEGTGHILIKDPAGYDLINDPAPYAGEEQKLCPT